MDKYITEVLFYAYHIKFEQVLGFLPSFEKKIRTLSLEKN
jgi:hypothetical protein